MHLPITDPDSQREEDALRWEGGDGPSGRALSCRHSPRWSRNTPQAP